jgi:branched-chain amino acid transport system substrate-binding protein
MMFTTRRLAVLALACTASFAFAQSRSGEIRIAHVYDKTGPLEAYAKQTHTGLMMGLSYATNGTMEINGKKLVVIEKDSQFKPDVGKAQLAAAYADDRADIAIGPTGSGVALAMLPVAEEYKRSCWWSQRWPTPSPVTSGTATSSAPGATAARMRSATPWRWTSQAP